MNITTAPFKISPSKLLTYLFLFYGKIWSIVMVIGIVACIVLGITVNLLWFVALCIWICIVAPMLMVFLYFYYGLVPLNAVNVISHYLKFQDDAVDVVVIKNEDEQQAELHTLKFGYKEIESITFSPSFLILKLKGNNGILMIDLINTLPGERLQEIINYISEKLKEKNDR